MWKRDCEKTLGLVDANVPEGVAVEGPQLMTGAHALPPPAQQAENALRHRPQPEAHLDVLIRSARDRPKGRASRIGQRQIGWPGILSRRLSDGRQSCEKAQEYQGLHVISFAQSRNVTPVAHDRRAIEISSGMGAALCRGRRGYLGGPHLTGRVKEH